MEADWKLYFGNNNHKIPTSDFKKYLGKPLSQELWNHLLALNISGLCIYYKGDVKWCLEWQNRHCNIYLDENDNVENIIINGY